MRPGSAVGLVCFAILVAVLFLIIRHQLRELPSFTDVAEEHSTPPAAPVTPATPPPISPAAPTAVPAETRDPALTPPPLTGLATAPLVWEQQVADAGRGRTGADKALAIFALLPKLPAEAFATAAEQAIDRLSDRDYSATAGPIIADPRTPAAALAVLFADLMERPDAIALPLLLGIARNPAHPFSAPALDNLRLVLAADHGSDWARWDSAVRERLGDAR